MPTVDTATELDAGDVERILQNVATIQGTHIMIVRVERLVGAWLVTISDHAGRIASKRLPDGGATEIRGALLHWLETRA
jgi:hypothetical protein